VRFIVLLVLLAFAPAAWCQAAGQDEVSPLDVIERCNESADEESIGLTALEEECPGLTGALEQSGYLALLSTAARDELDVYDLSDVLQVDAWYEEPAARDMDIGTLGPILDSLQAQEPERPLGWFERFQRWLRSMLERRSEGTDNWLSRWLDDAEVSEVVTKTILLVALALLLALTVFVIINELRAAGIFRQRSKRDDDLVPGAVANSSDAAADLDALPVDRKASLLLRMLVTTLVQSGRLRAERSLTHRELSARARFYGSVDVPAEEIEPIVAAARELDAQLRGAAA
jgi:hypothetical protein